MKSNQSTGPGNPHDENLKCDTCGCKGEARRASPIGDSPLREWLQPPTGWWVLLNEYNLRLRCPDCLDWSAQVREAKTTSSTMNKRPSKKTASP